MRLSPMSSMIWLLTCAVVLGPSCERDLLRRYLNAVQTTAQHLLRYLAAAVVVNKRRRNLLKDLVKVGHLSACPVPI